MKVVRVDKDARATANDIHAFDVTWFPSSGGGSADKL